MVYIVFLKDNIAVAKGSYKSLDNIKLGVYDEYREVTDTEYKSVEFPSVYTDGEWIKTEVFPVIDFPEPTEPEPTADELLNALLGVTDNE